MDLDIFLHALTSYFVIIDPLGAGAVFTTLTGHLDDRATARLALRTTLIALLIVLGCGLLGEHLLTRLGIGIDALRVAGGLFLLYTAFTMVIGRQDESVAIPERDISVYPMAIPLLAGPGCLTLTVLLFSAATPRQMLTALLPALLIVHTVTLAALLLAPRLRRLLGPTGDDILRRLFGVILAALAVQFIADGIRQMTTG